MPGREGGRTVDLNANIRAIPDYPEPGSLFWDITPLIANPRALDVAVVELTRPFAHQNVDAVGGIQAGGLISGVLVARRLFVPFVPVRKAGKLPYRMLLESYVLAYGVGTLEMQADPIPRGARVLVVEDDSSLLAAR